MSYNQLMILNITENCICCVRIAAFRAPDDIETKIIELLKRHLASLNISTNKTALVNSTYLKIHQLLITKGNKPEHYKQYGLDARGWYRASCEVLTFYVEYNQLHYWQLGAIASAFQVKGYDWQLIPVHNLYWEYQQNNLTESLLAPLENRQVLVEQVFHLSTNLVNRFVDLDDDELIKKLGVAHSRVIGYFPKAEQGGTLYYNVKEPKLTYGIIKARHLKIAIWSSSIISGYNTSNILKELKAKIVEKNTIGFCCKEDLVVPDSLLVQINFE